MTNAHPAIADKNLKNDFQFLLICGHINSHTISGKSLACSITFTFKKCQLIVNDRYSNLNSQWLNAWLKWIPLALRFRKVDCSSHPSIYFVLILLSFELSKLILKYLDCEMLRSNHQNAGYEIASGLLHFIILKNGNSKHKKYKHQIPGYKKFQTILDSCKIPNGS